ncbi:uncharacterized protein LOC144351901 [Saccoglossus kowalevskii]
MPALGINAKIAIGWSIVITAAVSSFVIAKKQVDKQRVENMLSRRRMREANVGEYEPVGYGNEPYKRT